MAEPYSCFFESREAWREWLLKNHATFREIWVIYYKKHTKVKSIVYREALEEALCFGWIDGIIKTIDDQTYKQRFSPRKPKGNWSETNIRLALQLEAEGRMHPSGLTYKERWIPGSAKDIRKQLTERHETDWESVLEQFPGALGNYRNLSPTHKKHYLMWIHDAKKEETRLRRMAEAIARLEKGEKLGLK